MYASWFQYNITKPYPFRWFTPVAIVGGIVLTAWFTFLTIATNGYALQPYSTNQPNVTMDQRYWFTGFAWQGSLSPTCQVNEIPIGSQFFTSNLGFSYTLSSVDQLNASTQQPIASWPTLPYLNQVLSDCKVKDIVLTFQKINSVRDGTAAWWSWDGTAVAHANCTISTDKGQFSATYTTSYNAPNRAFGYVIQNDMSKNTSMWWATRLLNSYWFTTLVAFAGIEPFTDDNTIWMRAQMTFTTNQTQDITSYNLFSLDYYFIASDTTIVNDLVQPLSSMYNNNNRTLSESLTQGLFFARALYSAILVDLGQANSPNLFLDASHLQFALSHPDDSFRNDENNNLNCTSTACFYEWARFNTLAGPKNFDNSFPPDPSAANISPRFERVLMTDAYDKYKPTDSGGGSLGTQDATIFTQYACSVPVRKGGGAIFLTVVVAVLVYLRTAWALLQAIAKPLVVKNDPLGANICSGSDGVRAGDAAGGSGRTDNSRNHWYSKVDDSSSISLEPLTSYQGHTARNAIYERL